MPSDRHVLVKSVGARWLYNHFTVGVVIIDCRSIQDVDANSIIGSTHIPPLIQCHAMQEVVSLLIEADSFSYQKRFLRGIVLVGGDDAESRSWKQRLCQLLVEESTVAAVSMLSDPFATFHRRYPFYTTSHRPTQSEMNNPRIAYPNEILAGVLYLGNMWQAGSKEVVEDLGITHVVNATEDLGNVFEGDGVRYHEVKIPDVDAADISAFFNNTFAFIEGAMATRSAARPHRVLVHCTQGISRSSTLVIAYLCEQSDGRWSRRSTTPAQVAR